jgi:16S rRNA (guanine966-N2)-methyltransferase
LRPTAERTREAIFNRLAHAQTTLGAELRGRDVIDVFAGSGAMGFEALSRGAARATLVEADPVAAENLRRVAEQLECDDRVRVIAAPVDNLPQAPRPAAIAFLDPPYGQGLLGPALTRLLERGWLGPGSVAVAETAANDPTPLPPELAVIDHRHYGRAHIAFLRVK